MASSASGGTQQVPTEVPEGTVAPERTPWAGPGFVEFVALMALMMGLTAVTIDSFLPAFPAIQRDFAVEDPNRLQLLVYVYMLGFGTAQLLYGPVSDGIGRRPALIAGIGIYLAGSVLAMLAPSFEVLLFARAIQGVGGAAGRVLAVAIVRDRYEGRDMARVMSFCMMVFLIVPILAPSLGSLVLFAGSWRMIFGLMLALALVTLAWFGTRLPETLHPAFRRPVSTRAIGSGIAVTVRTRAALGYATALGLTTGCIMGYVGSAQQVFDTGLYKLGPLFPVAFGLVAGAMGAATLINARVVRRLGMRTLSQAGTLAFTIVGLGQVALGFAYGGHPPLALFLGVLAANQFLISFAMPNFNALALEPLGAVAGTASSFLGCYTTILGALCGYLIGHAFDGTVMPIGIGYATLGGLALLVVAWTERGRLFAPGSST